MLPADGVHLLLYFVLLYDANIQPPKIQGSEMDHRSQTTVSVKLQEPTG